MKGILAAVLLLFAAPPISAQDHGRILQALDGSTPDSLWIISSVDASGSTHTEIFSDPPPSVGAKGGGGCSGVNGEPSSTDFSGPDKRVGLPDNGTVSWQGSHPGCPAWEVKVTWAVADLGTWAMTSFSTSKRDDADVGEDSSQ